MRAYHGWVVVAVGVIVLTLVVGAAMHAYGVYVLPVSHDFGLSRAEMNTGLILLNFGMAIWGAVIGRLLDRSSARLIMAASALLFGASFVALGLSRSLWLSAALLAGPLSAGVVGCGTLTSTALVARWFAAQRGRAMALTAIGISLGPLLVVPLTGQLVTALGWRTAVMTLGVAIAAVVLLLVPFVREKPDATGQHLGPGEALEPALSAQPGEVLVIGSLLRLPQFWTLSLSAALAFGIQQTIIVSMVPFAQGQGFTMAQGAALLSVFGGAAIAGKLVLAWLGDRFDRLGLLALLFALLSLAAGTLLLEAGYPVLFSCSALIGLTAGCTTPIYMALIADRFGAASFGTASGASGFVTTLIGAACIRFGGELFDRTGSYRLMFVCFVATGLFAAVLLLATNLVSRAARAAPALRPSP
jgi:MFS family permease